MAFAPALGFALAPVSGSAEDADRRVSHRRSAILMISAMLVLLSSRKIERDEGVHLTLPLSQGARHSPVHVADGWPRTGITCAFLKRSRFMDQPVKRGMHYQEYPNFPNYVANRQIWPSALIEEAIG